jgi:hypothetical protein
LKKDQAAQTNKFVANFAAVATSDDSIQREAIFSKLSLGKTSDLETIVPFYGGTPAHKYLWEDREAIYYRPVLETSSV